MTKKFCDRCGSEIPIDSLPILINFDKGGNNFSPIGNRKELCANCLEALKAFLGPLPKYCPQQ